MKIVFVIDKINHGGAERQLLELIKRIDKRRFEVHTIIFHNDGTLRAELDQVDNIRITSLNKKKRWDLLVAFFRFFSTLRKIEPDIIHSYMGVMNEISLLAGRLIKAKVVWGIRVSQIDFSDFDWVARVSFKLSAFLSRFVNLIIVNSTAGMKYHVSKGYAENRMWVIPNGIDTDRFLPDTASGRKIRAEWKVDNESILIGLVGRLHPMKDHPMFLRAAASLIREKKHVRFACVGNGSPERRKQLENLCEQLKLKDRLIWSRFRKDMPAVYNAFDIIVSSSAYGEGFSNAIGEAMACGKPCVVTDVGDSASIVGDEGFVVSPRNSGDLAKAFKKMAELSDQEMKRLGKSARSRIVSQYGCDRLVSRTMDAFQNI